MEMSPLMQGIACGSEDFIIGAHDDREQRQADYARESDTVLASSDG